VRIPLDYYRILGLPPQCSTEQIQQAHRDRILSMPRREYSDAAISSRKKIIEQAHSVLSEPSQRQVYDAKVLPSLLPLLELKLEANIEPKAELDTNQDLKDQQKVVVAPPTLEIDDQDMPGALLILFELGDYDQVLSVSQSYFRAKLSTNHANSIANSTEPSSYNPDVVLTVAVADLELGRERWKQGLYEIAAQALEAGQELLLREGLFLNIRSEIQADLFKLRPYRVLELLSASDFKSEQHKQGLLLLQEMLEARKGIDGSGNDYSGLNIDDFLRFIQQLRGYMTSLEQQTLFEDEARRPSPVASYLAVYALIARGFSQRQPALIRRAKGLLVKLSGQQDVQLEQAVCALLLGQTEEASSAMEQSQEQEQIDFIRSNSEDSPDLLPGLCLYCEKWLQEEVYPHFRDLANQTVSLRDYFADDQVQSYLEELSSSNGSASSEWNVSNLSSRSFSRPFGDGSYSKPIAEPTRATGLPAYTPEKVVASGRTSLLDRPKPDGHLDSKLDRARVSSSVSAKPTHAKEQPKKVVASKSKPKIQPVRFLIVVMVILAALGGVFTLASLAWRSLISPSTSDLPVVLETPLISPLLEQPVGANTGALTTGPLDKEGAIKVIESWQTIKSTALGKEYEIAALDEILAEPVLSDWKSRAQELKATNSYLQYIPKSIDVTEFTAEGDDKARALVKISETRNFFSNGNLDAGASKTDANYDVEYSLVRKDNKWLIQDMIVSD
jgi:hypothetical protein